jgi:alpha-L-fucosidase
MLVDIVCKGGNLLLNIAPSPEGTWDEEAYRRLTDIGAWMDINGEAIYGTRAIAPYKESQICYTHKKNTRTVYAIYMPEEAETSLPATVVLDSIRPEQGSAVTLLGTQASIAWSVAENRTVLRIPTRLANNPPCQHAWVFKIAEIQR